MVRLLPLINCSFLVLVIPLFVVHGVEYGYGAHEQSSSGIFEVEPKKCPGFTFRKSILVGETEMSAKEVRVFMEKLAEEYRGDNYHVITRNCNHFCNQVCLKLTQNSIPSWVNRLARLGNPNFLIDKMIENVSGDETKVNILVLLWTCKVSSATVCCRIA